MNSDTPRPVPNKLTLQKETLRRLTPFELRLAVGGLIKRCTYEKSGCYG